MIPFFILSSNKNKKRLKMKIFGIHDGGNIGFGLIPGDITRSNFLLEPYQIIATSSDVISIR